MSCIVLCATYTIYNLISAEERFRAGHGNEAKKTMPHMVVDEDEVEK